jgi:hypothetical protein
MISEVGDEFGNCFLGRHSIRDAAEDVDDAVGRDLVDQYVPWAADPPRWIADTGPAEADMVKSGGGIYFGHAPGCWRVRIVSDILHGLHQQRHAALPGVGAEIIFSRVEQRLQTVLNMAW